MGWVARVRAPNEAGSRPATGAVGGEVRLR
jgi:hypothetical protein